MSVPSPPFQSRRHTGSDATGETSSPGSTATSQTVETPASTPQAGNTARNPFFTFFEGIPDEEDSEEVLARFFGLDRKPSAQVPRTVDGVNVDAHVSDTDDTADDDEDEDDYTYDTPHPCPCPLVRCKPPYKAARVGSEPDAPAQCPDSPVDEAITDRLSLFGGCETRPASPVFDPLDPLHFCYPRQANQGVPPRSTEVGVISPHPPLPHSLGCEFPCPVVIERTSGLLARYRQDRAEFDVQWLAEPATARMIDGRDQRMRASLFERALSQVRKSKVKYCQYLMVEEHWGKVKKGKENVREMVEVVADRFGDCFCMFSVRGLQI